MRGFILAFCSRGFSSWSEGSVAVLPVAMQEDHGKKAQQRETIFWQPGSRKRRGLGQDTPFMAIVLVT